MVDAVVPRGLSSGQAGQPDQPPDRPATPACRLKSYHGKPDRGAALARLAELHPKLIDLGLDRSLALLDRLGNPQDRLPPVIHLAGTNGKGSTAAFFAAMAQTAGLSCHSYSSPHLCRFHERIRLQVDQLISDQQLADLLDEVGTGQCRPANYLF